MLTGLHAASHTVLCMCTRTCQRAKRGILALQPSRTLTVYNRLKQFTTVNLVGKFLKDTKISALQVKHAAVVELYVEHLLIIHTASVQR
jgi:hypothetical protein